MKAAPPARLLPGLEWPRVPRRLVAEATKEHLPTEPAFEALRVVLDFIRGWRDRHRVHALMGWDSPAAFEQRQLKSAS